MVPPDLAGPDCLIFNPKLDISNNAGCQYLYAVFLGMGVTCWINMGRVSGSSLSASGYDSV
jgi:hypothetical protein